jgi:hypothetical protein
MDSNNFKALNALVYEVCTERKLWKLLAEWETIKTTKPENEKKFLLDMKTQRWQDKQITYGHLIRILLISATIFLILLAGVVWILNLGGSSWSSPLAAVFIVLGVLFAFLQWAVPHSPS